MKKKLHWDILYVLPEVYDAVQRIVESCDAVSKMSLFTLNHGKSMNLQEFETQQLQATSSTIKYLQVQWLERIIQSIRMCMRDIGKGCFDLNQQNPYVYNAIKLRRLVGLKVLLMQVSPIKPLLLK